MQISIIPIAILLIIIGTAIYFYRRHKNNSPGQ